MSHRDDWRITDQERYLDHVVLIRAHWTPHADGDHAHCSFCWEKFAASSVPGARQDGYATRDRRHWICAACFGDFRERFGWMVGDAG